MWGLGKEINNMSEMYNLLLGLILAKDHEISKIAIVGYSLITIHFLQKGVSSKESKLNILLQRLMSTLEFFQHKSFFHVIRS